MRSRGGIVVPFAFLFGALLLADEGLDFIGNYSDFRKLPPQTQQNNDFTFVRLMYKGRIAHYLKNWYTDYPTGDRNLVRVLRRMTDIDVAPDTRVLPIYHPELFEYPMIYSNEAGQMVLNDDDARALREYLLRGGFWMIDDFWGTSEWDGFNREIKKVFPERPILEIPRTHPVFHVLYDIDETLQTPNIGYAYNPGTPSWEQDGYEAYARGIFADDGRLLVFINHNTDLMDALEWADDPLYPHRFSAYAYKVFSNAIVYALSH